MTPTEPEQEAGAPGAPLPASPASLYRLSITGGCPRCAEPTLFAGMLRFAPRCSNCGLDFLQFNVDDGPAAFLTFGVGTLITILAIVVELAYSPRWWVHVALWVPLTIIAVIGSLRIAKVTLLVLEYRNAAREGRQRIDHP
ncbi:DUF983 domain-containing protein [Sphingomonas sp. 37zxx]|uniref:DUF983 domain-containing protein n=1 Tax=Sphingomonas sp. 37zxx TaxID=1550073 RepID=UPI003FA769AF